MAKRYGAGVIALTKIDEEGMALTPTRKLRSRIASSTLPQKNTASVLSIALSTP